MIKARTLTSKTTIPEGTAGAGTITASNDRRVVGTGTNFKTVFDSIRKHNYLYIAGSNLLVRVERVISDTELFLEAAINVSGVAWEAVEARVTSASMENTGAANATKYHPQKDGTMTNNLFRNGGILTLSPDSKTANKTEFLDPIIMDATGTTVVVEEQY